MKATPLSMGHGTEGVPVRVLTNHARMHTSQRLRWYQYDVDVRNDQGPIDKADVRKRCLGRVPFGKLLGGRDKAWC